MSCVFIFQLVMLFGNVLCSYFYLATFSNSRLKLCTKYRLLARLNVIAVQQLYVYRLLNNEHSIDNFVALFTSQSASIVPDIAHISYLRY